MDIKGIFNLADWIVLDSKLFLVVSDVGKVERFENEIKNQRL